MAKQLTQRSAKPRYMGATPIVASKSKRNIICPGDGIGIRSTLKMLRAQAHVGSSPTLGTKSMTKRFTRTIEDFVCENCGMKVKGNGYTNHCPVCLYSKHVDINPGDRENICGGLMRPISVSLKGGEQIITHRCIACGFDKNNKTVPEDNFESILKI